MPMTDIAIGNADPGLILAAASAGMDHNPSRLAEQMFADPSDAPFVDAGP